MLHARVMQPGIYNTNFRFPTHFVDDMEVMANSLSQELMHTHHSIAGGQISGIHPIGTPTEAQGCHMGRLPYLDVI